MKLDHARGLAEQVLAELWPHYERCAIAGSVRRRKAEVGDIEIVCIPKPYDVGLFESGIASVVERWEKVKGDLPCKYTQRILPGGEKLDLFMARPENWGLIFAIRTGSARFSQGLAMRWVEKGFHSVKGMLVDADGDQVPVREEVDLFVLLGLEYMEPWNRETVYDLMEGEYQGRSRELSGGERDFGPRRSRGAGGARRGGHYG